MHKPKNSFLCEVLGWRCTSFPFSTYQGFHWHSISYIISYTIFYLTIQLDKYVFGISDTSSYILIYLFQVLSYRSIWIISKIIRWAYVTKEMRRCMLLATCRHTHSLAYASSGGIRDGSYHKGFLMIRIFLRQILAYYEFLTTSNSFIARTSISSKI